MISFCSRSTVMIACPGFWAVMTPGTPYWVYMVLALLLGMGGGDFSSCMPSTSLFFPKRLQGTALGIQAGIGNFGVSLTQFVTPWIIGLAAFAAVTGKPQLLKTPTGEQSVWLQNAALWYVPLLIIDEGLDFVERCYENDPALHDKGVFRYRPLESDPAANPQITLANTASSMLTLILGGRHTHAGVAAGAVWFRSRDYPRPWQDGYYYLSSYYSSQATAQVGGDTWNQIFPQIARNLLDEQTKEGNWPLAGGAERNFGTAYSTSLAILAGVSIAANLSTIMPSDHRVI